MSPGPSRHNMAAASAIADGKVCSTSSDSASGSSSVVPGFDAGIALFLACEFKPALVGKFKG